MTWRTRALLAVLAALVALSAIPASSQAPTVRAQEEQTSEPSTPDSSADGEEVIVVLREDEDPEEVARELGVEPTHIYTEVFTGFAATMPDEAIVEAQADRSVRRISEDGRVQAEAQVPSTGVRRIALVPPGSDHVAPGVPTPVDADIAILDTGVTPRADLNVAGGTSCIDKNQTENAKKKKKDKKKGKNKKNKNRKKKKKKGKKGEKSSVEKKKSKKDKKNKKGNKGKGKGKHKNDKKDKDKKKKKRKRNKAAPWDDDNGHGTHTAGIAAAFDNDEGVVGVAPGARIWAVKVLDATGGGSFSDVICGLDWVVANAGTIDVINLSLSGPGSDGGSCASSAFHQAICNVVNAGIPVVVAAGNQGTDAGTRVPGSFDEVITVSALSDLDGAPGRLNSGNCSGEIDDVLATFSNDGADVDIMAPGVCILSLSNRGEPIRETGTSEAAPHVTGAAAQFIAREIASGNPRPSPDQTKNWLLTEASRSQAEDGVLGDTDGFPEPVLWLDNLTSP